MTTAPPDRWSEIRPIFEGALDLSGRELERYLEEACGDDGGLRGEVEGLLAADRDSVDFLSGEIASFASELLRERHDAAAAPQILELGRRLGRFRIVERLGSGGMGQVYVAEDPEMRRLVALKILQVSGAVSPERQERFRREARALAAVSHPNVVAIHSFEEAEGQHFLAMELVDGVGLDESIPETGMSLESLLRIVRSIVDALEAIHARGITHRDLSSANVMLTAEGGVKVLDFGLAKLLEPDASDPGSTTAERLTASGQVLGTVPYMSPEQALGTPVDHRTDIFSLGTLLYEMATGRRPFEGETQALLIAAILRDDPPALEELRPTLPAELGRIVRRCLEKDAARRFQTATEVRDRLGDLESTGGGGA